MVVDYFLEHPNHLAQPSCPSIIALQSSVKITLKIYKDFLFVSQSFDDLCRNKTHFKHALKTISSLVFYAEKPETNWLE